MIGNLFTGIARLLKGGEPGGSAAGPEPDDPPSLDHLRQEVELEAQRTLDQIDDALTVWQELELRAERERKGVALWEEKGRRAEAEAGRAAPGSPEREAWERLAGEAESEAAFRRKQVATLEGIIEQAQPAVEEALRIIEEIGLSREKALSQIDRLEITQATAAAKHRLASARLTGETSRIEGMLRAAAEEIQRLASRADAEEELADTLDPGSVERGA